MNEYDFIGLVPCFISAVIFLFARVMTADLYNVGWVDGSTIGNRVNTELKLTTEEVKDTVVDLVPCFAAAFSRGQVARRHNQFKNLKSGRDDPPLKMRTGRVNVNQLKGV